MVLGIQLIGMIFGLGILYISFISFKKREFTLNEWGFWTLLGTAFIIVTLFPGILDPIVESLNIARTMDLLIVLGFMFLTGATFYIYTVARKTQKNMEELVRKLALKEPKKRFK